MIRSLHKTFRDNLLYLILILAVIFAGMNGILYFINQSYLNKKIETENTAFLTLTTHLINDNDVDTAMEYVKHYTHVHAVEIEVTDQQNTVLFTSSVNYTYSKEYQIVTNKGTFNVFIDNTESMTVVGIQQYFLYVNITLIILFVLAITSLYYANKKGTKHLEQDISYLLSLVHKKNKNHNAFYYYEFHSIYHEMEKYLEKIDLLQEQKHTNIKGLAHDIKTPLTIVYGFINRVLHDETIDSASANHAFDAAKSINHLVDQLIQDNYEHDKHTLQLDTIIQEKVASYQSIFLSKNIQLNTQTTPAAILWNKQDFSRIIDNILSNAFQYSKPESTVKIELQIEQQITLVITSTPENNNAYDITKLFEKGYSQSTSKNKGYGLYICKLLLATINGTITATTKENEFIITILI